MLDSKHGGDIYTNGSVRLDFSVNLNPLGMPASVIDAIREDPAAFMAYPDPESQQLRNALAEHLELAPDDILLGNGADDFIYRLCSVLQPREVLMPSPCFSEYIRAASAFGSGLRFHRLDAENGFVLTESFLDGITPDTRLVFLCTPNNPNGSLVELSIIEKAARRCAEYGCILVVDECFLALADGTSARSLLSRYSSLVVLDAFTKTFAMAGLRLGCLYTCNHTLLEALKAAAPCWSVSGPAQKAGLAALSCSSTYLQLARDVIVQERRYLYSVLDGYGWKRYPTDANYILFQCDLPLYDLLLQKGILIRNCDNYMGLSTGFYRICIHTHEKNEQLAAALKEIVYG